jgi:hypothetical protein
VTTVVSLTPSISCEKAKTVAAAELRSARPDRLGPGHQAIGTALSLAPKTVRNKVSRILVKLHATDRGEAIAKARRSGLGAEG